MAFISISITKNHPLILGKGGFGRQLLSLVEKTSLRKNIVQFNFVDGSIQLVGVKLQIGVSLVKYFPSVYIELSNLL